jgi:CheY-like chemotaxis protein
MVDSILLVDDEDLFHLVFEDACSLLNISLSLQSISSSDEAARLFKEWQKFPKGRPECVFVDLNIIGSTLDGIELVKKINFEYGNHVVIGIISSSDEATEQANAIKAGAQFWIVKTDEIEPRLEEFRKDYLGYKNRTLPFKIYR